MSAARKVLVISQGVPHPWRGASTVLFYEYLRAFKSAGLAIVHLVLATPRAGAEGELREYKDAIGVNESYRVVYEVLPTIHAFSSKRLTIEPVLPCAETVSLIQLFRPEATVCFDIVAAAMARQIGFGNLLIWLGDLAFQTVRYHAIYDAYGNLRSAIRLPRALFDSVMLKRLYRNTLKGQLHVVVSSKSSQPIIDAMGARSVYLPYPWPDAEPEREVKAKFEKPTFILFGTLAALGSKSAFHFLLRRVYPLLVSQWGATGFQILVAGVRELPVWVKTEFTARPALRFMGFVDDLTGLVDQCHGVLAPISVPIGNRSRIVTAMSMGSPIIAHKNTALGNPELISGENCYLAGSASAFASHMKRLADDPKEASRIGQAARRTYLGAFQPEVASRRMLKKLDSVLAQGPVDPSGS